MLHGTVFWITGMSGSGKTTIATNLVKQLRNLHNPVIFLDGDALRAVIGDTHNYSKQARFKTSMCYAKLCQYIASQGINVVCATISLFHETQAWNRKNIPRYLEIYLDVPVEILKGRDHKNIYKSAQEQKYAQVVGLDIQAEIPKKPDLVLNNYGELTPEYAADAIFILFNNSPYAIK